jgi:hypothetical protein
MISQFGTADSEEEKQQLSGLLCWAARAGRKMGKPISDVFLPPIFLPASPFFAPIVRRADQLVRPPALA